MLKCRETMSLAASVRDDVHVLDDAEVGAVDGQRAGQEIADDHVARQVPPLVERAAQVALLVPGPGMLGRAASTRRRRPSRARGFR